MDGEVVALDERGHPDFSLLQLRISEGRTGRPVPLVYQAFDLLYLDGRSLVDVPLESAQAAARARDPPDEPRAVRQADRDRGPRVLRGGQGAGPGGDRRQASPIPVRARPPRLVVAEDQGPARAGAGRRRLDAGRGEREGAGGRGRRRLRGRQAAVRGQGRVRVRRPDAEGAAGAARRARDGRARRSTRRRAPDYRGRWGGDLAGVRWIRPELVIRAEIGGWTRDGHVRQTAFKGLERGRDPREVVRERAVDPAKADREAAAAFPAPEAVESAMERAGGSTAMAKTATKTRRRRRRRDEGEGQGDGARSDAGSCPTAELDALALDEGRGHVARRPGRSSRSPTSTRCCSRPATASTSPPLTKRDLIAYFARIAPGDAAAPRRSAAQPPALPERRRRAGLLAEGHPVERRPSGSRSGTRPASASARTGPRTTTWSRTARRRCAGWATRRRSRSTPGPRRTEEPWTPTFALIDIDPGTKTTWDETLVLAQAVPDRPRAPRRPRLPQARPAAAASRRGSPSSAAATSTPTRAPGSRSCRGRSAATVPEPRVLGVGEGRSRRQGAPRLHPERGDQDARRAVRGPARGRAPRCPRRSAGRSSTTRRSRPDRWTIATLPARVAEVGDLWAGIQEDHQVLPAL